MASYNKVILMGNLTRDPEMRMLPSNTAVTQIGLAVNERWRNKQTDQWEERANFIDCEAFGRTAEVINQYFQKGRPIFIEGRLRMDQWEDKQTGQKRSKLKVVIDSFEFVGGRDGDGGGGGSSTRESGPAYGSGRSDRGQQAHTSVEEDDIPF